MAAPAMILLKSDTARLIYVPNPKAGSTSIYRMFLDLAGIEVGIPVRKAFRSARMVRDFERAGVFNINKPGLDVKKFAAEHPGYFWFSFVRNPYDRVVSNYHNKLNRFAVRYAPAVYVRGKMKQLLGGPRAWRSHVAGVNHMQEEISFPEFVHGLETNGVSFDRHFDRQTTILRPGKIAYDFIGKVENFADDTRTILARIGGTRARELLAATPRRENASRYDRPKEEHLTPAMKEILYRLYKRDFERFGYASELEPRDPVSPAALGNG
jgi:hypothetical protein